MIWLIAISIATFLAAYLLVRHGHGPLMRWLARQEQRYERVLVHHLLLTVNPRWALAATLGTMMLAAFIAAVMTRSVVAGLLVGAVAWLLPHLIFRHLEQKRRQRLERQLPEGLTTLASAARAGLNLVQAMELLTKHHNAPIRQEFTQILREYQMGLHLDQALKNASDRIGSPMYRLTFKAIEMHRLRGGDTAESLDRIADAVRDIERLEGKLDALTAQGRSQAAMMAVMPLVFLAILYLINPAGVALLFLEPLGRILLLGVGLAIAVAFAWIRRIMAIDL
jgi:tight adherence protein B